MEKGVRLIVIGLALTHEKRKEKIKLINENINGIMDSIRSSSDVDGLPHAGTVTDPVSAKAIRIEALEAIRDLEQERVNAIEWAEQCIRDRSDDDSDALVGLLWAVLRGDKHAVDKYIDEHPNIAPSVPQRLKSRFVADAARYLSLADY